MNLYQDMQCRLQCAVRTHAPQQDVYQLLLKHRCHPLLAKTKGHPYAQQASLELTLNRTMVYARYQRCKPILERLDFPHAVIKGAALSKSLYDHEGDRISGDVDILTDRDHADLLKDILREEGFVQGRICEAGILPYTRQEQIFQATTSHQLAPFTAETGSSVCPYVQMDINLDILWGECTEKSDMQLVLEQTEPLKICGVETRKLRKEMEFIALCLHHYKDLNSIYLLYERGLPLGHFCDIYLYLKRQVPEIPVLLELCQRLGVTHYICYCIYCTNMLMEDELLANYLRFIWDDKIYELVDCFGLNTEERKKWKIDFWERLFCPDFLAKLRNQLTPEDWDKIFQNQRNM